MALQDRRESREATRAGDEEDAAAEPLVLPTRLPAGQLRAASCACVHGSGRFWASSASEFGRVSATLRGLA